MTPYQDRHDLGRVTEGARLHLPDIAGTRRLLRLTAVAEARSHGSAARTSESRAWITAPWADRPYASRSRRSARRTRRGGCR
ncbi:hypothetical protein GCM10010503_34770 [Streptomyces lucensis JCM 4490]|uniref:Uncharacterized protein n=1 Tax=Streptomyces lucensis JCM 4490 TaxID=1306176 RepID=A0A918J7U3_9ACTN|nr:hypothetical protein GCM10010503_34770 [Streptomyces lucensis JCM 4490]